MKQSPKKSLIESIVQTVIGLGTSIILQLILYPMMDIPVKLDQNLIITLAFFVVSFVRGYLIRRWFENL